LVILFATGVRFATGVVDTGGNLPLEALPNLPQVSTTLAKLVAKFVTGVVDIGGKFSVGVIITGGNFAAGVIDNGGAP
jgi:hypothetical protein